MRLAIFFPVRVLFDGYEYTEESNQFRQFLPLKQYFDEIDLVIMLKKDFNNQFSNSVDLRDYNLHGLPFYRNGFELHVTKLPHTFFSLVRLFFKYRHRWDAILIFKSFLPNHICYLLGKVFRKPIVFYVNGGHEIFRWDLYYKKHKFTKRLPCWFLSKYYELAGRAMIKHAVTIVDSKDVFDMFRSGHKHLYRVFSTAITSNDILQEKEIQRDSKGVVNLLTVCRVHPQKGLEYLIEAVGRIKEFGINVKLNVVGPLMGTAYGNYEEILRKKISQLGLSEDIKFLGSIGDRIKLLEFYKNADVFVLPSLSEGSPKVIPEAMACGLPVVATNIASIPDLIEDGREGVLVRPGDIDGLSSALIKLAKDPFMRYRMGKAALAKAREFTLDVQMEKFAGIIKSAALEKGGKSSSQ